MSPSEELQKLVFDTLVADPGVAALVAGRIYDRMPSDGDYPCVTFGPTDSVEDDSAGITGEIETMQIDCWSRDQGRLRPCKEIVAAVKGALHKADLALTVNALVQIRVESMRVFLDADAITAHGVVMVEAILEQG